MTDRKALRSLTAAFISVLLIALLLPDRFSGAIVPAILLLPLGILAPILIKKRSVLSLNRRAVFCLFLAFGATYLLLYYLTGIEFGFVKNIYVLSLKNFIGFIVPISVIIVSTEIMRAIIIFQEDKLSAVLARPQACAVRTIWGSSVFCLLFFCLGMNFKISLLHLNLTR